MRHLIILILATLAPFAQAVDPFSTYWTTLNAAGNNVSNYWMPPLGTGTTSFIYSWDGTTSLPKALAIGSNLSISSGTLNAASSTPSPSSQTRSFNSAFQPSTFAGSRVHYACKITTTASIGSGQEGEIILEQADDSGFTTNVVTLDILSNAQTYTLAIALQGVQSMTGSLGADYVPAGKYLRLRTNNITGTPSYTFRNGREVLE